MQPSSSASTSASRDRRQQALGEHRHLVADRLAALDELDEAGAGGAGQLTRVRRCGRSASMVGAGRRSCRPCRSRRRARSWSPVTSARAPGSMTSITGTGSSARSSSSPAAVAVLQATTTAFTSKSFDEAPRQLVGVPAHLVRRLRTRTGSGRCRRCRRGPRRAAGRSAPGPRSARRTRSRTSRSADPRSRQATARPQVPWHRLGAAWRRLNSPNGGHRRWCSATATSALIRPITPDDRRRARRVPRTSIGRQPVPALLLRQATSSARRSSTASRTVDFVDRVGARRRGARRVRRLGQLRAVERTATTPRSAFMVDDRHHGKGIATLLLEHLAAIARSNGIDAVHRPDAGRQPGDAVGVRRGRLAAATPVRIRCHRRRLRARRHELSSSTPSSDASSAPTRGRSRACCCRARSR